MLQCSSSQTSSLRWRYFVESLLLKSTPNVSSVVLSSARVAGVDRADARASSVAREPPRGFFGETAALRVAGFLAGALGYWSEMSVFRRRCERFTTAFARARVSCAAQVTRVNL